MFNGIAEEETEGMLQVRAMKPLEPATAIDDVQMALWRSKKEVYRKQGFPDRHVVLVDFVMKGTAQRSTFAVGILDLAFDRINSGATWEIKSAMFGSTIVPLSVASCFE